MATIAIIGTGRMGKGLGIGWARAGHQVIFGSRTPDKKDVLTDYAPGARVTTMEDAVAQGEVVVLAIPFPLVENFARTHAAALRDKLVIDISNPFDRLPDKSMAGAEITAHAIGPEARVIAAFKDNFSDTLAQPKDKQGRVRDVHFAGNDEADKRTFAQLVSDLGFQPVDCGPLKNARVLDGMVSLIVEVDRRYANGERRSSWKLIT